MADNPCPCTVSYAVTPDDRCDRQSERRRGQDHDRHQPGGRAGAARQADAARSTSIPRPTARCRTWTSRRVTRSVYDAISDPNVRLRRRHHAVDAQPNLLVAPSRIALAKLEAKLVGELDAHFRLKDRLEPIREQYPEHRHRLPADAGPADRQRAGGGDAPVDSDPVVVFRARRAPTICWRRSRRCGPGPTRRCGSSAS